MAGDEQTTKADADAMERLRHGDLGALADIYLRHADRVMAVTARVLPELGPEEVEDICQEVFLRLADLAGRYEERGRLGSYLVGVAVRMARNRRRKIWIHERLLREKRFDVSGPTSWDSPESAMEHRDLARAFQALGQKDREVLVLSVVDGLDAVQIGEILDLRPGSVWSRLHRARRALAKKLARGVKPRR